jgi:hypothetical protein
VEHWFLCPLRASDHDSFFQGTGVVLSNPGDLPTLLCNPTMLVTFEHVLSRWLGRK